MATQDEKERLAIVETEVKNVKDTVQEVRDDVKTLLGKIESLDDKYPTRREMNVLKWIVGTLIAAVSAIGTVLAIRH